MRAAQIRVCELPQAESTLAQACGYALGLRVEPNLAEHPIGRLIEAGVLVTVNSDDPNAMNLTVSGEFLAIGSELDWGVNDVARSTYTAIDAAFCDADCAQRLRSRVDAFLAALPSSAEIAST